MTGRKRPGDDLGSLSKRQKLLGGSQSQGGNVPVPSGSAIPLQQSNNHAGNLPNHAVPVNLNTNVRNTGTQNQANLASTQQVPQQQVPQQQAPQPINVATTTAPPNSRVSVGPAFAAAPGVDYDFKNALIGRRLMSDRPKGLSQGPTNVCYRNAALTAFLSTETVRSYLAYWRVSRVKEQIASPVQNSILMVLQSLARQLFEMDYEQGKIDEQMKNYFWERFCYPRDKAGKRSKDLEGSWQLYLDDRSAQHEEEQHDCHEFFMWLFQEIATQFKVTDHRGRQLSSSERFDWLIKSRQVTRTLCERCEHRVQMRSQGMTADFCLMLPVLSGQGQLELADLIASALRQQVELRCPRCKIQSDCVRETKFQHVPPLLMIRLAPTEIITKDKVRMKDPRPVRIPAVLDMSRHLNIHEFGEGSRVTYSLSSVVSHAGEYTRGHFVSYVRGDTNRQAWFELDDQNVRRVVKTSFDDSQAQNLVGEALQNRFMPFMLFYERNFDKDVIQPGRAAMNINEGEGVDESPSQQIGASSQIIPGDDDRNAAPVSSDASVNINVPTDGNTPASANPQVDSNTTRNAPNGMNVTATADSTTVPPPSSKVSNAWISGLDEDEDHSPAVIDVTITIGGIEIPLPRQIITQFNQAKRREIKIEAKLRTPTCYAKKFMEESTEDQGTEKTKSQNKSANLVEYAEIDLVEAQEEGRKRAGESKKSKAKPKDWRLMWLKTGHDADLDLNSEEVKELGRLREAKSANAANKQ